MTILKEVMEEQGLVMAQGVSLSKMRIDKPIQSIIDDLKEEGFIITKEG